LIYEGNIYLLEPSCIERATGYDSKLEIMSGWRKIKRILSCYRSTAIWQQDISFASLKLI
jgi:hypothetical protein